MSSGKVHSSISVGAATGVSITLLVTSAVNTSIYLLFIPLGVLAGVFITPDLDQDSTVVSHKYSNIIFGRMFGLWWYYLWHSYGIAFKHRSKLSHWPILSTIIRLTYLVFPPIIILLRNQHKTGFLPLLFYSFLSLVVVLPFWIAAIFFYQSGVKIDVLVLVYFVAGLMISDTLHYLTDAL